MNIRYLQVFATVEQLGSLSKAALRLGLSQPAVSRIVRELEARMGVRLFQRTGRGVTPTAAGMVFGRHAGTTLAAYDELIESMEALRGVRRDADLSLGLPLRIGRHVTMPLMKTFYRKFPSSGLHVYENLNLDTQEGLAVGTFDIGIFYLPPTPSGLSVDIIGREAMYVIGQSENLPGEGDEITMAEAGKLPVLTQSRPAHFRMFIEQCFLAAGHEVKISRELDTLDAHISFALEGEGVTILPFSSVCDDVEQGALVAKKLVEPEIHRDIGVAIKPGGRTKLVEQTLEMTIETLNASRERLRWLPVEG